MITEKSRLFTIMAILTLSLLLTCSNNRQDTDTSSAEDNNAAEQQQMETADQQPRETTRWGDEIQTEEERQALLEQWEEGRQRFMAQEVENGSNYHYVRVFGSWTGYAYKNTIWIENGEVVRRSYSETRINHETNEVEQLDSWDETVDELGSHTEGFPLSTMYDLYDECHALLQSDLSENAVYFTADERGLITTCETYPYGCVDDCGENVAVADFSFD